MTLHSFLHRCARTCYHFVASTNTNWIPSVYAHSTVCMNHGTVCFQFIVRFSMSAISQIEVATVLNFCVLLMVGLSPHQISALRLLVIINFIKS